MIRPYDIVVVGAGPAGLAAATAAATAGRKVAVLDDNPRVGGQIWRSGAGKSAADRAREQAVAAFHVSGAELFAGRQVVDATASEGTLEAWFAAEHRIESFRFESLILATGARERFLPFPGWTLPGVFGAGGLQALVRGGYEIRGKRVVVAGTGPLLLAVAAHLKQDGAGIVTIAEQASMGQMAGFGVSLVVAAGKGAARSAAACGAQWSALSDWMLGRRRGRKRSRDGCAPHGRLADVDRTVRPGGVWFSSRTQH